MSQQPFAVPSTIQPELASTPIRVPDAITGDSLKKIPEWEYKKLSVWDIFHTKLGISVSASLVTFFVLAYLNPPFVQEKGDNSIEIGKPSMRALYTISIVVFFVLFFVPVVPKSAGGR